MFRWMALMAFVLLMSTIDAEGVDGYAPYRTDRLNQQIAAARRRCQVLNPCQSCDHTRHFLVYPNGCAGWSEPIARHCFLAGACTLSRMKREAIDLFVADISHQPVIRLFCTHKFSGRHLLQLWNGSPRLEELQIFQAKCLSSGTFRCLRGSATLRILNLTASWNEQLDVDQAVDFMRRCPELRVVQLMGWKGIEDRHVTAMLRDLPSLKVLGLAYCVKLTDEAFLAVPNRAIEVLSLDESKVTDTTLQAIDQWPIRELGLQLCEHLTYEGVRAYCERQQGVLERVQLPVGITKEEVVELQQTFPSLFLEPPFDREELEADLGAAWVKQRPESHHLL